MSDLTLAQAIAKAVEMGGGEVWESNFGGQRCLIHIHPDGTHKLFVDCDAKKLEPENLQCAPDSPAHIIVHRSPAAAAGRKAILARPNTRRKKGGDTPERPQV